VNTYDPADYISYVTMDRQLSGGGAPATPVGTGGRLPLGYENASPSTGVGNRPGVRGAFDDADAAAPVPPMTAVVERGTASAAAWAAAPAAVPCHSDGTPDERVRPVLGSLARRAACGGARPADPAAVPLGRPSSRRGPLAL
jgi:hypothetical protein